MSNNKKPTQVDAQAKEIIEESRKQGNGKQFALWMAALVIGGALGWMNNPSLNELFNFVATIFTRLFQFIAVPTIALAVITTFPLWVRTKIQNGSSPTPSFIRC